MKRLRLEVLKWLASLRRPETEPDYMRVRRLAAKLWIEDGRIGSSRGLHGFMVCYPPTRQEYENRAKIQLGLS